MMFESTNMTPIPRLEDRERLKKQVLLRVSTFRREALLLVLFRDGRMTFQDLSLFLSMRVV